MTSTGKALARERSAAYKRSLRETLRNLRAELRTAREARREAIANARALCKSQRLELRDRLKERRARLLAELREAERASRHAARASCSTAKHAASAGAVDAKRAAAKLAAERAYQADLKRIESWNRAKRRELSASSVRRTESDDEVRGNLAPELVALFERVKHSIKGTARISRTESFLHYVEEHPREHLDAIDDITEKRIRELEARERETAKLARRRRFTAAELAEVPF